MKFNSQQFPKTHSIVRFRFYCTLFILTGIISLGISQCAWADLSPLQPNHTPRDSPESIAQHHSSALPPKIADAVRQDASRRTRIAAAKFNVVEASQKTWPDGCLGIAQPDEICTQALVEGWRVVVSDGQKSWIYRTDAQAQVIRLET